MCLTFGLHDEEEDGAHYEARFTMKRTDLVYSFSVYRPHTAGRTCWAQLADPDKKRANCYIGNCSKGGTAFISREGGVVSFLACSSSMELSAVDCEEAFRAALARLDATAPEGWGH